MPHIANYCIIPDYVRKFLNLKNMSLPPPKKNKNGKSTQYTLNIFLKKTGYESDNKMKSSNVKL